MIYLLILLALLLAIAMLCRSLVHTLLHHYGSLDAKYDVKDEWWNPTISWKNKYVLDENNDLVLDENENPIRNKKMVQFSDAFHTFNTIELGAYCSIISILTALVFGIWWIGLIAFAITGTLMVLIFNLGYDKLWR